MYQMFLKLNKEDKDQTRLLILEKLEKLCLQKIIPEQIQDFYLSK